MNKNIDIRDFVESEGTVESLWQLSEGTASGKTFEDLMSLNRKIDAIQRRRSVRNRIIGVFSAVAVLAGVVVATYSLTKDVYNKSLPVYIQKVTAYGDTASVRLPDGTLVAMNAGSSLIYPDKFADDTRTVFFTGEGNFSVAKDPDHPFIVKTAWMDVKALGTRFCIQSYSEERTVRTTLEEGRVQVAFPSLKEKSFILDPDTQIAFTPSDSTIALFHVNAEKVALWEQGYMVFNSASFQEIVSRLERKYGVSFVYDAAKAAGRAFNLRFTPEETLSESLDVLTWLVPHSRYRISGNKVYYFFQ